VVSEAGALPVVHSMRKDIAFTIAGPVATKLRATSRNRAR
jgi:hypothetical protein